MGEAADVRWLVEFLERNPEKLAEVKRILAGEHLAELERSPRAGGLSAPTGGGFEFVPLAAMMVGDPVSRRFSIHYAPVGEAVQGIRAASAEASSPDPAVAAKVFQLLNALDPSSRWRRAPPITVFLLHYRRNLSCAAIARECNCAKSLVKLRLQTIREKLPWKPQQLRELSAQVEAMQEALSDSRARRIYRKGAVYGEEEGEGGPD